MEFGVSDEFIDLQNHKYNLSALVSRLDRSLLRSIENIYRRKQQGLDLIEFIRFFMNCLEHSSEEAPLLAAALSQLFQTIVDGKSRASFSAITDYVCDVNAVKYRKFWRRRELRRSCRDDGCQYEGINKRIQSIYKIHLL